MSLYFESTGEGSPALVFTHGLAADHITWQAQVEHFSQKHRVVTWDLRGHGKSDGTPGPCRLADLAADLGEVLDRAGEKRAVLVGHSAGGVVVMRFTLDHPERAAGIVLVGTASECNARGFDYYDQLATLAEQGEIATVRRRLGVGSEADGAPPFDARTFSQVCRAMGHLHHEPLTPRLAEIRCPALILVGEKDFLGAGGSVIMSRVLPDARLEIVPGRGHGLFLEDPAGFNRLVAEFVEGLA
jgi:pimeloyl-ACP methyl ester carboxylesterase